MLLGKCLSWLLPLKNVMLCHRGSPSGEKLRSDSQVELGSNPSIAAL